MSPTSRRQLLAAGAGLLGSRLLPAQQPETNEKSLPVRTLGKTGRKVPALGLGCYPLGRLADEDLALNVIHLAWESGARYFDTAPSYNRGRSESRLGKALGRYPRQELFLATKTLERSASGALKELDQSLKRLQMEYVDSVQVHEVRSAEDVEALLAKDGVLAGLERARKEGKIRHIGLTCHRDPKFALLAIERYPFATALVPVNPLDCHHLSFTQGFVAKAAAKGVAVIAMKVYAGGALPKAKPEIAAGDLLAFALNQPGVTVAVPGADSLEFWRQARQAAVRTALSPERQKQLIAASGPHHGKSSEWYKNSS
ncbi:MAG: aldo/keto reductase [Planctomycetota bacterium]|nr:MAG: aldo/keto reductase [Planctomycetota bacterium]